VSLIGHSHVALHFRQEENGDGRATGSRATDGEELDLREGRWLVNPGSVGQPRDSDPRAAWLELDTDIWKATYHRLEYDIDRAAGAIVEAGLPRQLADRLYVGI
jgi:diadenosine tetraphosphatase ApaH/serine/threonine PP2A family protein phosphatase